MYLDFVFIHRRSFCEVHQYSFLWSINGFAACRNKLIANMHLGALRIYEYMKMYVYIEIYIYMHMNMCIYICT